MILTLSAQREFFEGCEYVVTARRIRTPLYGLLNRAQFKVVYGGHDFLLDVNNEHMTRDAWKAAVTVIPKRLK